MGLATHGRGPIGYTREQQPSERVQLDPCIINDKQGVLADKDSCVGVRGRGVGVDRIEIKPHVSRFVGLPRQGGSINVNLQPSSQQAIPTERVYVDSNGNDARVTPSARTAFTLSQTAGRGVGQGTTGVTKEMERLRNKFEHDMMRAETPSDDRRAWR